MIKRLGAHLKKLGLKTKMVLGDTGSARGTYTYCLPAANDPEAVQYIGAVAFHSWGGASPKDYRAWSDLADRLKLPLLDTELGVDLRAKPHAGELPRGICAGQPRGAAGAGSG